MENKGYPEVNLDSWVKVGEGGNGVTYEHPEKPDLLLKLNNGRSNSYEVVKEEFDTSAAVSRLGLPTPAMYEMVRVGDAYATVSQIAYVPPTLPEKIYFPSAKECSLLMAAASRKSLQIRFRQHFYRLVLTMTNFTKFLILTLSLCAISCAEKEFTDSVSLALAAGGEINLEQLKWTREPASYEIKDGTICITTAPHTDLWQRTYYHFRNDNAPVLQMQTREKFFSFVVKTDFTQSHQRFDQCGIVMYLDSENWLKGSVEFENEAFQHLGSVATNNGYSDWATTAISADVKTMWYRFSRREDDFCIECSTNGVDFSQMRICHMSAASDVISFGIYACSPEESSFTAVFSDMKITECMWKAHDGQQPDAE